MALAEQLNQGWQDLLSAEFEKPYWSALEEFVARERATNPGKIYPPHEEVFAALNFVRYDDIKVVLLGQDPYHGPGQAHGLSFSVKSGIGIPPSLRNMYKELASDLGVDQPDHGMLTAWAEQGVLLLNTVLTVRHKEANSHRKQGWEKFTDAVIELISAREDPVVFLLWGGAAKKKTKKIAEHHVIIASAHPSPLSARHGFFGSKPYSKANAALREHAKEPIDWAL
ncbi:MAG: uracil-DNA glycosylase [Myxococcota bacterium]